MKTVLAFLGTCLVFCVIVKGQLLHNYYNGPYHYKGSHQPLGDIIGVPHALPGTPSGANGFGDIIPSGANGLGDFPSGLVGLGEFQNGGTNGLDDTFGDPNDPGIGNDPGIPMDPNDPDNPMNQNDPDIPMDPIDPEIGGESPAGHPSVCQFGKCWVRIHAIQCCKYNWGHAQGYVQG